MKKRQFFKGNVKFEGLAEQWIDNIRLRIKESTYVKYRNMLQNYILPYFAERKMQEITTEVVEEFVKNLLTNGKKHANGGLAEKTVKDILAVVKAICQYGECHGLHIPCQFEMIKIRRNEKEIQVLNIVEQRKLESFLMSDSELTKTGVLMSLYMGLRLGEVCALKREQILYREGILKVRFTMQRIQNTEEESESKTKIIVTEPKSSCSIRDIPIPSFLLKRLEKLRDMPGNTYVLTGSAKIFIEPRTMENIFHRYLRTCQIQMVNFHTLRHTFATRCMENGFDIKTLSEILGHANVNITLNRYVHSSMAQKRKNMDCLMLYPRW